MRIDRPREYVVKKLRYAFNPASVAVVGASDNPGKVGFQVVHDLMRYRYKGTIYPVNNHYEKGEMVGNCWPHGSLPDPNAPSGEFPTACYPLCGW
jgi:hypothetical protein